MTEKKIKVCFKTLIINKKKGEITMKKIILTIGLIATAILTTGCVSITEQQINTYNEAGKNFGIEVNKNYVEKEIKIKNENGKTIGVFNNFRATDSIKFEKSIETHRGEILSDLRNYFDEHYAIKKYSRNWAREGSLADGVYEGHDSIRIKDKYEFNFNEYKKNKGLTLVFQDKDLSSKLALGGQRVIYDKDERASSTLYLSFEPIFDERGNILTEIKTNIHIICLQRNISAECNFEGDENPYKDFLRMYNIFKKDIQDKKFTKDSRIEKAKKDLKGLL
jgi:hypothetical protein